MKTIASFRKYLSWRSLTFDLCLRESVFSIVTTYIRWNEYCEWIVVGT